MLRHTQRILTKNKITNYKYSITLVSNYSKRSSESPDVYKVIKSEKSVNDFDDSLLGQSPNWELFSSRGYRFYMPGSVGPAWHDLASTSQFEEFDNESLVSDTSGCSLECIAQECPLLLRKGILEMFPGTKDFAGSQLTVVTLTQKSEKNLALDVSEVEREKLAKNFVVAAQEISTKLKLAGYWADFINPFSGLPYLNPTLSNKLFTTDMRFRCLGFEITNRNNCAVIGGQTKVSRKFVGSLFTTGPSDMVLLKDILHQYE